MTTVFLELLGHFFFSPPKTFYNVGSYMAVLKVYIVRTGNLYDEGCSCHGYISYRILSFHNVIDNLPPKP